ncbi:MAG: GNAT family N-acetyltransferase [Candidatus Vogelbacteria bacterium]|nr:GNAT family N-acetyltransferase [Candidatus Vogelbacteria bacterium]
MPNIHLSVVDRKYVHSATFGMLCNDVDAVNALLRELAGKPDPDKPPKAVRVRDRMDFIRIALQDNLRWVVARDIDKSSQKEPNIVGMAMVHWMELGSKINAYVDDIVVLETYRGQKIGKKLMEELIKTAKDVGAECVDLTSKPSRTVANLMYVKMGFEKRDTNYYRLRI